MKVVPKTITRSDMNKFLEELSNLTKKYNISIDGCGCCGSPYLTRLEDGAYIGDCLSWDNDKQTYEVDSSLPEIEF